MKKLNLKKLLSLTAAVALTLSLAACSGGTASSPPPRPLRVPPVLIAKLIQHHLLLPRDPGGI